MEAIRGFTICVQEDGLLSVQKADCPATLAGEQATFEQVKAEGTFRSIASMQQKLDDLHLLVQSGGMCVMVEGYGGCGKSALLRAYTSASGYHIRENLVVIHLGEQIDGKMLLGTFTCTTTPGEFVWLPGVLTKAVAGGKWVIMEDVDAAPPDVFSLLLPLVKSCKLMIPGYAEPLKAAPGFKLFLTRREVEGGYSHSGGLLSILRQHSSLLPLPPLIPEEVKQIVEDQYPNLRLLSDKLVQTSSSLNVQLRCILKLCERVSPQVYGGRISSVEDLMLELVDCFGGHLPVERRLALALELRSLCGGIAKEKVEQLCMAHKPSLQISPTTVTVGRAYLARMKAEDSRLCYAHTQGSLRLLESVCRCVQMNEPVLLVGETGVGKTATVNYLAKITGNKLVVVNMSQQTDSTDLLGGFKPVQVSQLVAPVKEEFECLFHATFSVKQNAQFLASIQVCFSKQHWKKLFKLMSHSLESALKRLKGQEGDHSRSLTPRWSNLKEKLSKLRKQMSKTQAAFAFAFVEGALVEAVSQGWWILLDEINLASAETLQCLSSLLEGPEGSFLLTEKGDSKMVERHPNFRLFCCMNPATDIGKKAMPQSIRSRFTEFFVDELQSTEDLRLLVLNYLKDVSPKPTVADGIIKLYRSAKELALNRLQDGTGRKPHYSLRSLCRALVYAANNYCGMFLRSLYEGFCMSFFTEVCTDHHHLVTTEIQRCLNISDSCISGRMSCPKEQHCVQVEGFWLPVGSEIPLVPEDYILTGSVKRNLKNLARVVSARQHPVLLQGPTSAGKTSLIQYLARVTGHRCLRINNHEHTDLQEYVGMYTASSSGQLIFQEGVLVDAMRNGYWIILDELNLAPTDVLEALNRVLDDNRELFIPETQELVKAHSHFLLFGAQNPPGLYGGRKVLSRAFRNRFIELHFDDIPAVELVTILHQGSQLPQSYAKKMVAVMKELQQRRSYSGVFAGKYGLITLRDLFRWAERYRKSVNAEKTFYDWEQQLAEDGFMLLGGRLRNPVEEVVIQEVIQKHFKRPLTPSLLFGHDGGEGSLTNKQTLQLLKGPPPQDFSHLVWTPELLKMAVLLYRALQFDEPVLLVGNTGCGKTTLCHLFASLLGRDLSSINCHMHTEAADFLGGLRPVRTRTDTDGGIKSALFEWTDGIIVQAMKNGSCVLIDEISLAEDAVLERLNSVLEPERKLLVAERSRQKGEVYEIVAQDGFALMATMNPGGDYGKKELSPALRNRFVEIWCPSASGREGYLQIIEHNLVTELGPPNSAITWSSLMMDFIEWLKKTVLLSSSVISIRDLLAWVTFMNTMTPQLTPEEVFYHGAHLVFLDALACGDVGDGTNMRTAAVSVLLELIGRHGVVLPDDKDGYAEMGMECTHEGMFGIPPFYIERGSLECSSPTAYNLEAPGPRTNAFRILRAMQLGKPLLLEGAPGVGKTSLVTALAQASGHPVTRINLSEHTDVSDLFGSDLPVEGGKGVNFAWRDGPFLKALKNGDWILLDEMNLASQSVLEGLNACLDHRGEVYIPELGMAFKVQLGTRLFACQNPLQQGGGRKGLPKSFLNRFTQVYVDVLSSEDLLLIVSTLYPSFERNMLQKMITFNAKVEALVKQECGSALWEFNLRDLLRWCDLIFRHQNPSCWNPGLFVDLIYCRRLRNSHLRSMVRTSFMEVFECPQGDLYLPPLPLGAYFCVNKNTVQVGHTILHRETYLDQEDNAPRLLPLYCQMPELEALMTCVQRRWMAILVGGSCSGKCSTVRTLASLTGHKLLEFPMNSDTDVTELLGGFEQVNFSRHCSNLASMALDVTRCIQGSLTRDQAADPVYHQSCAALDLLAKKLSTGFSPAMCLEDCSPQQVAVLCKELKAILLRIGDISSELNTTLPYRISDILMQVDELSRKSQEIDTTGQFEWVDSVLVRALKYGHWLLISNANFCSPSVLDRLNPLLEPNGVLSIDERGIVGDKVPTITPHPNFRLFLSMNPLHGEISRAMRNRGIEISILPEESLDVLDDHHSEWDSLLSAQRHCDNYTSNAMLQMCSGITGLRVNQALQAAKCYQLLHDSQQGPSNDWLTKACQLVGIHKTPTESSSLNTSVKSVVRREPATVNDYVFRPNSTTVYRDIVSVLMCLNPALLSGTNCNDDVNSSPLKLSAALEVFVANSTLEDHQSRTSLLEHLLSIVHLKPWASVEVNAAVEALAVEMKCSDVRKFVMEFEEKHGFPVGSLTALVNPHICCMAEEDRSLLFTFTSRLAMESKRVLLLTLVEQHSSQACLGYEKSVLQLSHDIHTGVLPLQLSTNRSFMYIYPFLCALLSSLQGVADTEMIGSTETSTETLHLYFDWITMFVRMCMAPGCSLSATAVAWSLLLRECVKSIIPFLEIASDFQLVQSLLKGLQGLEDVVKRGKLFATVRKVMGHPRRTLQHTLDLKNTAQIVDCQLRKSKDRSLPFLMLKDQSVVEERRTVCLALLRAHLAEWIDCADGMEFGMLELQSKCVTHSGNTEEHPRDNVPLATAIQPIVHCLKRVATDFLSTSFDSWNCPLTQVGSLLDYCLQLSAVGVLQLEALIVLQGSCSLLDNQTLKHDVHLGIVESLLPGFLDGCCSGLSVFEPMLLADDASGEAAVPLFSVESCCSRMCFGMLSPYSCGEESKSDSTCSVTLSIGNHLSKMEELKALLHHLWLHGCSSVFSPQANIALDLDLHKLILRRLIRAAQCAVQSDDLVHQEQSDDDGSFVDSFPESISGIRSLSDHAYSSSIEWSILEQHLVSAHDELTSVTAIAQQDGFVCSTHSELTVLHSLNCAKVHLGIALSLVLCPPAVDPVALDFAHHLCIHQFAKQTQCLVEAWDHHYEVMVGKGIQELLDLADDDSSEIKNLGVAPNLVSLLKKRKVWTDKLHCMPPPCAMTCLEEKKYSSLVYLCTDVMESVCAPSRIQSILIAANEVLPGDSVIEQVVSWTKAVSAAISRLKEDFKEFPDVVEPFVMALDQIIHGVNSVVWLKLKMQGNAISLVEFVKNLVQFPFFTSTTRGYLQWVKLLTSVATSGVKGVTPDQWPKVQKRIILVALGTCQASVETLSELPPSWRDAVWSLLDLCWSLWLQSEEEERRKAHEKESLYRFQSKTHMITESEDTIEQLQLQALFPSFESDFLDSDEMSADRDNDPEDCEQHLPAIHSQLQFSPEEMEQISSLHGWACDKWYRTAEVIPEATPLPLREAYYLAGDIYRMTGSLPGYGCDYCMVGGHARVWWEALKDLQKGSSQGDRRLMNIYKDSAELEAQRALSVMSDLRAKTRELLLEWPEHPGLKQIIMACEKVLSLDVREPLMKILTGLEYVLRKAQDWEAFASSRVSLRKELESLTHLILDWRKTELNSWKGLLLACAEETKTDCGRWWFHLKSLCHSQTMKGDQPDIQDFIATVQKFVETSSVGEFGHRLHLLKSFSMEMLQKGCATVSYILGNTFRFYSQFLPAVTATIQQLAGPLEKEFKEYLTILRWNDGNYWAVKATTEKSHRTLVKFVNKYKGILQQPVGPLLTDTSLMDREESCREGALVHLLREQSYLSPMQVHDTIAIQMDNTDTTTGDAFARMQHLVQRLSAPDVCLQLTANVDDFAGEVIEIHDSLKSTESLKELKGEKRKAAIKLSNTQKRKTVSELFRALKQQGLSYRKGDDHSEGFKRFSFKLPTLEPAREESCMTKLLGDVHKCYYCCLARMGSFQTAVAKPSKELTLGLVSRCKGYASYLMTLVCEQRIILSEAVRSSCDLQHAVGHFEVLVKDRSCIEATEEFIHWQSSLSTCLEQSLEGIYSFSSLVSTMPEKLDFSLTPLAKESLPPIVACGDEVVAREAATILMSHVEDLKLLYATTVRKEKDCRRWPPHFINRLALGELQRGFVAVEKFVWSISEVLFLTVGKTDCLGMLEFLGALQKQLRTECKGFAEWLETVEHSISVSIVTPGRESLQSSYCDQVNGMTKMILLAVQRVMNRHRGSEMDMNEGIASCKHLHLTVMDNLSDMKVHELLSEVDSVLQATPQQEIKPALKMLSAVYPLLHQYSKLYEKLLNDLVVTHQTLCKLLSALLCLFSTLATKGFCTPPEETEVEEGRGTEMVDMEAGGFDEGEGDKNVSCDVEPSNLEDLESKKREQDERKECEHEEEAVEMSADFDGTFEDVEEGEGQSEGEGDDEDDDKEMGDLGPGDVEQLDKNMWAPDENEENQKLDELEKQDSGDGTAIEEETKIVAKDGDHESTERQPKKSLQAEDEQVEPEEGEDVSPDAEFHAFPQPSEEPDTDVPELTDLDLDAGEEHSGDEEGSEGFVEPTTGELQESDEECSEDGVTSDKDNLPKDVNNEIEDNAYATADIATYTGVDTNALQSSDDLNSGTHDDKEAQAESQGKSAGTSTKLNGEGGSGISGLPVPEEELAKESGSALQHIPLGRHRDDYTLDDSEERAIKRPRLMESDHSQKESSETSNGRKESALYQHMSANSNREHDMVAWDAAPMEHFRSLADEDETSFKPGEDEDEEMDVTDIQQMDQLPPHQLASEVTANNKHPLPEAKKSSMEPDNSTTRQQWDVYHKESFIGAANLQFLEPIQDADSVRESLKSAVSILHSEQQSVDASQLWLKYEALTSSLSQSLCEELRIILQPTQAAQLKGDYRTGKRLNMRRIIPYIASRFQNDRIWLRRAKQTKRVYQILIAVDDSSSMNENDCNQMAYESLALISTSLSRLDCGQLGICRFGETVEVLHPLDQPFSTSSGGFVLQNLNFAQTKTNFKQLLEAAQSIFADYLSQTTRSSLSPEISQLLVVLSDGRGVFADGTLAVGLAMRRLNEMGVFTVFVILDSLSKDSVVDIRVPTFNKGKQPVIRTYLETFPFPFYIVLRDINTLPIVLGQALRQWFELVIMRTSALP